MLAGFDEISVGIALGADSVTARMKPRDDGGTLKPLPVFAATLERCPLGVKFHARDTDALIAGVEPRFATLALALTHRRSLDARRVR
jgi:hypothetical protein